MLGKQQALAWIKIINETNNLIYAVSALVTGPVWRLKGKERKQKTRHWRIEFKMTDQIDRAEKAFKNRIQAYAGKLKRCSAGA